MKKDNMTTDKVVLEVIDMLNQRSKVGVAKYSKPLQDDGRSLSSWCTMAQEEMLDGANYLQKIKNELAILEELSKVDTSSWNCEAFEMHYNIMCNFINKITND